MGKSKIRLCHGRVCKKTYAHAEGPKKITRGVLNLPFSNVSRTVAVA